MVCVPGVQQGPGSIALGALSSEMPPEPVGLGSARRESGPAPSWPLAFKAKGWGGGEAVGFWTCCCARAEKAEGQAGSQEGQGFIFPLTANGTDFPLTVVDLFSCLRHSVRFET